MTLSRSSTRSILAVQRTTPRPTTETVARWRISMRIVISAEVSSVHVLNRRLSPSRRLHNPPAVGVGEADAVARVERVDGRTSAGSS